MKISSQLPSRLLRMMFQLSPVKHNKGYTWAIETNYSHHLHLKTIAHWLGIKLQRNSPTSSATKPKREPLNIWIVCGPSWWCSKRKRNRFLGRSLRSPQVPKGLYFYGGVGRGKSFLMDAFFGCLPYRRKRRVHFHAFMAEIHQRLKVLKSEANPLKAVATEIAKETRVLCFDEFHVSDIADAMILGRFAGKPVEWRCRLGSHFQLCSIWTLSSRPKPQQFSANHRPYRV